MRNIDRGITVVICMLVILKYIFDINDLIVNIILITALFSYPIVLILLAKKIGIEKYNKSGVYYPLKYFFNPYKNSKTIIRKIYIIIHTIFCLSFFYYFIYLCIDISEPLLHILFIIAFSTALIYLPIALYYFGREYRKSNE